MPNRPLSRSHRDAARGVSADALGFGLGGPFAAGTFAVAVAAGVALWRLHPVPSVERSDRRVAGAVLIGFGLWYVVDNLVFHWTLGWHHIRMDSPRPLVWDAADLAADLAVAALGAALARSSATERRH